jgi:hypothetical protein
MGVLAVAGQKVPASFPNQYYGYADTTATTVTAASQTVLATPYTIPANEPLVGSAYQVHFGGTGVWGSTQQLIGFTFVIQGVTVVNTINAIANTAFSASAGFRYTGYGEFVFQATGASGAVLASLFYTLTETANNVNPGTASTNTVSVADSNSVASTIDTTAAIAVNVKCGWGGTTGAPTISNRHTIFRKIA